MVSRFGICFQDFADFGVFGYPVNGVIGRMEYWPVEGSDGGQGGWLWGLVLDFQSARLHFRVWCLP